jgi:cytochrome c biogenesis factor
MEQSILYIGLGCYLLAAIMSLFARRSQLPILILGSTLHGIALMQGWLDTDHGPYLGLYDSLSSNLSSFNQSFRNALSYGLVLAMPFVLWLAVISPEHHSLPPTYATNWFYLHLYAGKLAYGLLFIAITLSIYERRNKQQVSRITQQTMLLAFICHSLLLLAGGNWAYLAWGKYWDWNALEIWSLLTWMGFGLYFHRPSISGKWLPGQHGFVAAIYLFAILGFYGIPFLSKTTHQGLV